MERVPSLSLQVLMRPAVPGAFWELDPRRWGDWLSHGLLFWAAGLGGPDPATATPDLGKIGLWCPALSPDALG